MDSNAIHHQETRRLLFGLLFLLLSTLVEEVVTIRLEHVEVPSAVTAGESVALHCNYDLQDDQLYTVKWYKDDHEFYRWVPKRNPPRQTFDDIEGISVDEERSGGEIVMLKAVTPATSGFFRCDVSGERPAFRSDSGGAAMTVVILPRRKPDIFGGFASSVIDDGIVEFNCTTDGSYPAAQIRWYINGIQVDPRLVQESSVSRTLQGLETSFSVLELQSREHFPQRTGPVTVACEAAIPYSAERVSTSRLLSIEQQPTSGNSHQFQRRIASESHSVKVFQSRTVANSDTYKFLTLRKEIILYVTNGAERTTGAELSGLVLLLTAYALS